MCRIMYLVAGLTMATPIHAGEDGVEAIVSARSTITKSTYYEASNLMEEYAGLEKHLKYCLDEIPYGSASICTNDYDKRYDRYLAHRKTFVSSVNCAANEISNTGDIRLVQYSNQFGGYLVITYDTGAPISVSQSGLR